MVENVIQRVEQLLRDGKGVEARSLLIGYIQQNPASAQGWWLLSFTVTDKHQQVDCLERVIQFDPNYFPARTQLEKLKGELVPKSPTPFFTDASQQAVSVNRNVETHPAAESEQPRPTQRTARPVKSSIRTDWIVLGASFLILMSIIIAGFGVVVITQLRHQSASIITVQPTADVAMVSPQTLPPTWTATVTPVPFPTATLIAGEDAATSTPQILFKLTGPSVGLFAPDFTLTDVASGNQVSMSNYTGKAVLLYFWATWCPHCADEVSSVQSVYSQYRNKGFAVLAIDVGESAAKARNYGNAHDLTFSILNDSGQKVAGKYRVTAFPTNFFITSKGQISSITIGAMNYENLQAKVNLLLALAQ